MPLDVEVIATVDVPASLLVALPRLLTQAATHESLTQLMRGNWSLVVRITDDDELAALHGRFFGDPSPTDVISFPSGEPIDADAGHLGDIVISWETARQHAAEIGHSAARETAFLALHGLLHLCGYDDRTADAREAMLNRQSELLAAWESTAAAPW